MKTLLQPLREKVLTGQVLNESLKAAEVYGSLLHMIDIGQYDDPQIEISLTSRAYDELPALIEQEIKKDCLHIITEAFIIGGHTRLMEKLGSMHSNQPDLLITRRVDEKARPRLNEMFSEVYEIASDNPLDAVVKIRDICARYQRIVLHIHFDDIATVIACGLVKKVRPLNIYFVNHADHAFTYGSSIADFYFQLSTYGARIDRTKTIAGKTSFLGIPIAGIKAQDTLPVEDNPTALNFFSSGSALKFRPFRGANMSALISRLLTQWPQGTFTLVGIKFAGNMWLWPLKLRFGKRLKVLRLLPYDQFISYAREADFYVDSYPFPGGTAFAEQVLSGKRSIGLTSSVQGYSPADKLKRQSIEEVVNTIKHYDDQGAYEEIISVNGYDQVKARYLACLYAGEESPLDMETLVPWTGDIDYLRADKSIFMPFYPLVMKYVYTHHRKLFWGIYFRFSPFNKTYFTLKSFKDYLVNKVRSLKKK